MTKAIRISQNSIRILLGIFFIVSAVMKVLSLDTFVMYVYSFQLFPLVLTEIACRLLIGFEMLLGVMLVLKLRYKLVWWTSMALMVAFTLFLIYTAIFRNDDNCHCFGDIVEVKPVVSIFKNLVVMLFFLLIYEWKRRTLHAEETVEEEQEQKFRFKDLFLASPWYSKTAKIIIYVVAGLLIFVAAFVLFPPTAIYNKIFSKHNLVATPVYEKALNDSLVYLHYENIRYHEAEDTVTFQKDTVYCQLAEGTYIVPVVSAGCKYCKQSCELVHNIFERNHLPADHLVFWIWGVSDPHCGNFLRVTQCWEHEVYRISPQLAIDMVYGTFPTFLVVRDGEIIDVFGYRGVEENNIVDYVTGKK